MANIYKGSCFLSLSYFVPQEYLLEEKDIDLEKLHYWLCASFKCQKNSPFSCLFGIFQFLKAIQSVNNSAIFFSGIFLMSTYCVPVTQLGAVLRTVIFGDLPFVLSES